MQDMTKKNVHNTATLYHIICIYNNIGKLLHITIYTSQQSRKRTEINAKRA